MRLFLFLSLALACASEAQGPSSIEPIDLAERIAAGTAPVILDVRSPEEFSAGHIPGALNVPHTELAYRLAGLGLSPGTELVVHCEMGGRAASAEKLLLEAGFHGVRDLRGHMQAWRAGKHPVE